MVDELDQLENCLDLDLDIEDVLDLPAVELDTLLPGLPLDIGDGVVKSEDYTHGSSPASSGIGSIDYLLDTGLGDLDDLDMAWLGDFPRTQETSKALEPVLDLDLISLEDFDDLLL